MKKIIIISTDPETARTLSLRFELEDYAVDTAIDFKEAAAVANQGTFSLVLIDMVVDDPAQWKELKDFLNRKGKGRARQTVLMLPRGLHAIDLKWLGHKPALLIRKPYDLEAVVREVNKLQYPQNVLVNS